MKNVVLLAAMIGLSTTAVVAQDSGQTAMEVAQSQNACADGTIVSARYLDDGRVAVRCSAGAAASNCIPIAAAASDESELRALRIAQAQNACDDGNIVSARFTNDGEVRVRCASASAAGGICPAGTVLAGTATAAAGAAVVGAGVATNFAPIVAGTLFTAVLGAAATGSGSSTSDTR